MAFLWGVGCLARCGAVDLVKVGPCFEGTQQRIDHLGVISFGISGDIFMLLVVVWT